MSRVAERRLTIVNGGTLANRDANHQAKQISKRIEEH